jgi:hypothetical protein
VAKKAWGQPAALPMGAGLALAARSPGASRSGYPAGIVVVVVVRLRPWLAPTRLRPDVISDRAAPLAEPLGLKIWSRCKLENC